MSDLCNNAQEHTQAVDSYAELHMCLTSTHKHTQAQ